MAWIPFRLDFRAEPQSAMPQGSSRDAGDLEPYESTLGLPVRDGALLSIRGTRPRSLAVLCSAKST